MRQLVFCGRARRIVGALATIACVAVATASPESTAGTAAPDLRFCFKYTNETPYASKPVYLYWFDGSQQRYWKSGRTGADGCGTFRDVVPGISYSVIGYWTYSVGNTIYAWHGATSWTAVGYAHDGLYSTPTGVVSRRVLY